MKKGMFNSNTVLGDVLRQWWEELHGIGAFKEKKAKTADRAELSRASTIEDIILLPSFQRACLRFKPFFPERDDGKWERSIERLAIILGLLAQIREHTEQTLPLQMASQIQGDKPVLSELRFRRLVQRDRYDLYQAMCRVLPLLGNKANIYALANDVYYWGKDVKREWAFSYFPNTPAMKTA
jgi:CRISPR system Cascade subunit CasB